MAFSACRPLGFLGKRKIVFKGSFTEEELENTELSQWLKLEELLLNTFLSVHIEKLRNSMCNAIGKNLVNFKYCH
jgi:hypothetical protein